MGRAAGFKKRSRAVWCIGIGLFGLTVMGARQLPEFQSSPKWTTIDLPNPPAPLPESNSPYPAELPLEENESGTLPSQT